ncbi:MAG: hypothetical protein HYY93_12890 [Planctomycetes bacterium]|nr:hypothetical protein [Planctomycetota bacterium]
MMFLFHRRFRGVLMGAVAIFVAAAARPCPAQQVSGDITSRTAPKSDESASSDVERANNVTQEFKDKPLVDVLAYLSAVSGVNLIPDPGIEDKVTLQFVDLPWREALDEILHRTDCLAVELGPRRIRITKPPRVDMEFKNAPLDEVVNNLAKHAGANIIISPGVISAKPTVTLRLSNVPWGDALDAIVKTAGFATVREEYNVIRVVEPNRLVQQMETRLFELKYIKPPNIYRANMSTSFALGGPTAPDQVRDFTLLTALRNMLTTAGGGRAKGGTLDYDKINNVILVTDIKPVLDDMEKIIRKLDIEPEQVQISVQFVSTSNRDLAEIGVRWGSGTADTGLSFQSQTNVSAWNTANNLLNKKVPFGFGHEPIYTNGLGVGGAGISAALRLFKDDSMSEIVQSPVIICMDNQEATISVGNKVPFVQVTVIQATGSTSTSTSIAPGSGSPISIGFQLIVVPHIVRGEDQVMLTMIPQNTSLSGTGSAIEGFDHFEAGVGGNVQLDLPRIRESTLVTHMVLNSNQTAIVGGLIERNNSEQQGKVPFLGDVPILGRLFRANRDLKTENHFFVFATPRIIRGRDAILQAQKQFFKERAEQAMEEFDQIRMGEAERLIKEHIDLRKAREQAEFERLKQGEGAAPTPPPAPPEKK